MKFYKVFLYSLFLSLFIIGCGNEDGTPKKKNVDIDTLIKTNLTENMNDPNSYSPASTKEIVDYPLYKLYKHKYRTKNSNNALMLYEDYVIYDKANKTIAISIPSSVLKQFKTMLSMGKAGDYEIEEVYGMLGSSAGIELSFLTFKNNKKLLKGSIDKIHNLRQQDYNKILEKMKNSSMPNTGTMIIKLFRVFPEQTLDAILDTL